MSATPTGQRSPRWALLKRFTIPCQDGLIYLARLRIVQTPWFGIYVHDIYEPDGGDPHNHPWSFVSIVLRGHYVERLYPEPGRELTYPVFREQRWRRFSAHRMGRQTAHVITEAGPGLKTLILVGPRRGEWGFFKAGRFIDWRSYEGAR